MIIDIQKIAEDEKSVCYSSKASANPTNVFLVSKIDCSVATIIVGDELTMAGAFAKIRRSVKSGDFPNILTLSTG